MPPNIAKFCHRGLCLLGPCYPRRAALSLTSSTGTLRKPRDALASSSHYVEHEGCDELFSSEQFMFSSFPFSSALCPLILCWQPCKLQLAQAAY